jgi:TonB family protein
MVMRRALFLLALPFAVPATGQQAAPVPASPEPPTHSAVTVAPAPASRAAFGQPAERVRAVDIPHWAKDAGHNGGATYIAQLDAEGRLISLRISQSSGSSAIDEAVLARAQTLVFKPARDVDGNPVRGSAIGRMSYARWDANSPGGGIAAYTCGDLVREHDWFAGANAGKPFPFAPKAVFYTVATVAGIEAGAAIGKATIEAELEQRDALWDLLLADCRKTPERLMLDLVDYPDIYRRLMDGY